MRKLYNFNSVILAVWLLFVGVSCGIDTRTPEQIARDEVITKSVLKRLDDLPLRPPPQDHLKATTENGIVHLQGVVEDWFVRDKAIELAKSVEGVREVTQNIRVEPERGGGGGVGVPGPTHTP